MGVNHRILFHVLTACIAGVWLINGLVAKVLGWVPRHGDIVSRILSPELARELTLGIGFLEIVMAAWVVSGIRLRLNAITQIVLVVSMNLLEFYRTPELLLWGRLNLVFALLFVGLVYYRAFRLYPKIRKVKA